MRRVLLLASVVVVAAVVGVTHGRSNEGGGLSSLADSSSTSVPSPVVPRSTTTDAASRTPTSTTTSVSLRGGALARAWLTGYLSRATRDDTSWVDAVTPLSAPELITHLRSAGPDFVGLDQLSSWRVIKVELYKPVNPPVDTESRQLLAYAATVTDGTHTAEKPFELYAYRQDDGRWLISVVDQPYSSEG